MSGKPGGKPRKNPGARGVSPHLKKMRQQEALERNAAWAEVPLAKQLELLRSKFPGGAVKQKLRIRAALDAQLAKEETALAARAAKENAEAAKKEAKKEKAAKVVERAQTAAASKTKAG